jgi:hypothetical protein
MTMQSLSGKGDIATVGGLAAVTLQPSAAKTANEHQPELVHRRGGAFAPTRPGYSGVVAFVIVTAVSLAPTPSDDGQAAGAAWITRTLPTPVSRVPRSRRYGACTAICIPAGSLAEGEILQAVSTITGTTPSFTYSIVLAGVKH